MFLEEILKASREDFEARRRRLPLKAVRREALAAPPPLDFPAALRCGKVSLIAELKKASPSRGVIREDFHPADITRLYADNGAAAISVLTEPRFFQGSLDYLRESRAALDGLPVPLLRKDFITEPYQVYESRAYGADSLLLIVAALTRTRLAILIELSRELGMIPLVEVHNETELDIALATGTRIIGINNRDLKTFEVDIRTTERLCPLVPRDRILVSESGIKSRSDIEKLGQLGVNAVLIGEALMAAPDIGAKMRELL